MDFGRKLDKIQPFSTDAIWDEWVNVMHHSHYDGYLSDYTQLEIVEHFEWANEDTYAHYANTHTPRPIQTDPIHSDAHSINKLEFWAT